jgi:hypothetical protein
MGNKKVINELGQQHEFVWILIVFCNTTELYENSHQQAFAFIKPYRFFYFVPEGSRFPNS